MKKISLTVLSFSLLAFAFSGCYYDNFKELNPSTTSTCDSASSVSFATQIVPILNASCTNNCHNSVGNGHDMLTWASVNADATSGTLVGSIVWDGVAQQMPQGATVKISDCDIAKVKKWVSAGALNN